MRTTSPESRVLTCVYCGHEYPQETPAWGTSILTEHIKICEKHPLRKSEADVAMLRKALIGLVGIESLDDLEKMEAVIRMAAIPDEDRASTINALHAIRNTNPKPAPLPPVLINQQTV